jgi:type IV pilus assembly protein PilE
MTSRTDAFTLLELVIALAIAATLAVFAVPAYRSQIARTHRTDAAAALYRAAQFVETDASGERSVLPVGLDRAPQFGTVLYRLTVLPVNATNGGYTLEAVPAEDGPMHGDACGTFVLDATGLRSNRSGNPTGLAADECWNTR